MFGSLIASAPVAAVTSVAAADYAQLPRAFTAASAQVDMAETRARTGLADAVVSGTQQLPDLARADAQAVLGAARELQHDGSPFVIGGLLAMLLVTLVDQAVRRRTMATAPMIDHDFDARVPVIVAAQPARAAFRDAAPEDAGRLDPLRHFDPDAPPLKPSPVERSRPDYIRVDDSVEMWTPARVEAARSPTPLAKRRRTDAPGADYRFHRLNADGSVKTAERHKFVTDVDAQRFAETVGQGDAVEVWLGDRRLTTIPPNFFN